MQSAASLVAQAAQGAQAWSVLDGLFTHWASAPSADAPSDDAARAAAAAASSLLVGGEASLRAAWQCLTHLGLGDRFLTHLMHTRLRGWLHARLVRAWWRRLDAYAGVQRRAFGA